MQEAKKVGGSSVQLFAASRPKIELPAKSEFQLTAHPTPALAILLLQFFSTFTSTQLKPLSTSEYRFRVVKMISDVTLSALANWLGSLTMILIVLYHVSCFVVRRMILLSRFRCSDPRRILPFSLHRLWFGHVTGPERQRQEESRDRKESRRFDMTKAALALSDTSSNLPQASTDSSSYPSI